MIYSGLLPSISGYRLTSITVELLPGSSALAHKHDSFVYVYVIEGRILSQLNQEEPTIYSAGDSWTENPGDIHRQTRNMSSDKKAKMLVVFIGKDGARLTTSGDIH